MMTPLFLLLELLSQEVISVNVVDFSEYMMIPLFLLLELLSQEVMSVKVVDFSEAVPDARAEVSLTGITA